MTETEQQIPLTRRALTLAWRKAKMPRLFWAASHPDWRWDTGEIARMVDHPVQVHFYTLESIREELEQVSS